MKLSTAKKLLKLNYDLYEKQAHSFSNTRNQMWEKEVLDFVSEIPKGSFVLDLGCGNGRLFSLFREKHRLYGLRENQHGFKRIDNNHSPIHTKKRIIYLGLDSSRKLIKQAHKKYNICNNPSLYPLLSVSFKRGDGLTMKFKNQFDYIISHTVLHHIPSCELQLKFLRNIHQALKPKSKALISVWNRWSDRYKKYFTEEYKNDMIKMYPRRSALLSALVSEISFADLLVPWKQSGYYRYIHAFKPSELKNLAQEAGFKNIQCFASKHGVKTNLNEALNIYLIGEK